MSKERLEEIERQLNRAEIKRENLDIEDFQNILEQQLINGNLKWLVKYAKKQAERVQELEEDLLELVKQNKRYREALEFYADEENYCVRFEDDYEPILQDNGKNARQALEESK